MTAHTIPQTESCAANVPVRLLIASLEALAAAGQPDLACRLAGQACAAVRHNDPAAWHHLNIFLHRMIRHLPAE
jgi:hypothetical protein